MRKSRGRGPNCKRRHRGGRGWIGQPRSVMPGRGPVGAQRILGLLETIRSDARAKWLCGRQGAPFGVRKLHSLYNIAKSSLIPDTVLPRALLRDPAAYTGTNVSKARKRRSAKEFRANGGPS